MGPRAANSGTALSLYAYNHCLTKRPLPAAASHRARHRHGHARPALTRCPHPPPSPAGRLVLGLICVAGGLLPILAAFDLGPLGADAINGPRWLGFLAGAIFAAGGVGVMLGSGRKAACRPMRCSP